MLGTYLNFSPSSESWQILVCNFRYTVSTARHSPVDLSLRVPQLPVARSGSCTGFSGGPVIISGFTQGLLRLLVSERVING